MRMWGVATVLVVFGHGIIEASVMGTFLTMNMGTLCAVSDFYVTC